MGGQAARALPRRPSLQPRHRRVLARDYDGNAAYIVLGHLSETNNVPELALLSAEEAIRERGRLLGNRVLLAQQSAPIASICL